MHWSPVHKSANFWQTNAAKFGEKNYEILKILIHLLKEAEDPTVLAVALHDIGSYAQYHARGKINVERLEGKVPVMKLMQHSDASVRYESLVAVQRLMVRNHEFLSAQTAKVSS